MGEITGTDIFEAARDKLTALVTALISTQSGAGTDPAVGYIYDTGKTSLWEMIFTVRVHTAYLPNGIRDDQKVARLLNSLVNKFQTNIDLGNNFRIDTVGDVLIGEEFDESATYGGQLSVMVNLPVVQTQE